MVIQTLKRIPLEAKVAMTKIVVRKISVALCALVLSIGMLAGCAGGPVNGASEEQQANRTYMSQVNQAMVELGDNLDQFVDAVSRDDVVNMRTQADNAYKTLDKLSELEAPEALADVKQGYVDGTSKLREALDEYIKLYTEARSDDFDWSKYDNRVADVQKLYDEGVSLLQTADETAAQKG